MRRPLLPAIAAPAVPCALSKGRPARAARRFDLLLSLDPNGSGILTAERRRRPAGTGIAPVTWRVEGCNVVRILK